MYGNDTGYYINSKKESSMKEDLVLAIMMTIGMICITCMVIAAIVFG